MFVEGERRRVLCSYSKVEREEGRAKNNNVNYQCCAHFVQGEFRAFGCPRSHAGLLLVHSRQPYLPRTEGEAGARVFHLSMTSCCCTS